jgi:hypothetical protein
MNKKTRFLVLSIILIFALKGISQDKWKGAVIRENDLKVIKNPREPLHGDIRFDIVEEVSIGGNNDENYQFFRIRDIKVDKRRNIYVLDQGNFRVQIFNEKGLYLRTLGRQGQGPGEFQRPVQIAIDKGKDIVYVKDYPRLKVFDANGKLIDDFVQRSYPLDFIIDNADQMWGVFSIFNEDRTYHAFCVATLRGKIVKKFAEFPITITTSPGEGGNTLLRTGKEYALHFAQVEDQKYVYGFSDRYRIYEIDELGKQLFIMEKDEPARSFSDEERKQHQGAYLPEHVPYFYSLLTDSEGRIYVQRNIISRSQEDPFLYDIFSKEGVYYTKDLLHILLMR